MNNIPTVTRNLLIINVVVFIATYLMQMIGADLNSILGLHFILAPDFQAYQLLTYMFAVYGSRSAHRGPRIEEHCVGIDYEHGLRKRKSLYLFGGKQIELYHLCQLLKQSGSYAAGDIIEQELACSPCAFDDASEHPEGEQQFFDSLRSAWEQRSHRNASDYNRQRRDYGNATDRTTQRPETDAEYNERKRWEQQRTDAILDKIRRSGYDSLSNEEKQWLFDKSRK